MISAQESHLSWVLSQARDRLEAKFRAGDAEHKGPGLMALSESALLDHAIEEAIDQVVYLLSLKRKRLLGVQTVRAHQAREKLKDLW